MTACEICGKVQPLTRTADGQQICALCWNDPDIAARRRERAETRAKALPRSAHFLNYSLPSVAVDGGEVCLRFDYPGGYDQHRLSRKEAKQIAAELELALGILAQLDKVGGAE